MVKKSIENENNIKKIVINAKSFGEYNGTEIYLTSNLYSKLQTELTRRDKIPILKLMENGRALQGLKHLIGAIKEKDKNARIILSLDTNKKAYHDYYIDYNGYRKTGQSRFFKVYRETGIDTANYYLANKFPSEFMYDSNKLNESDIKKVKRQFSETIDRVANTEKNQVELLSETNKLLRKKLKRKSKGYKEAVNKLRLETNLSYYQQRLDELKQRLDSEKEYSETKGRNSWQSWIYNNNWLFGINYLKPIEKEKVGWDNIPDYIFPTRDGFLDILEIKKPKPDVIRKDENHSGSHVWCPITNAAIGQVVNYLQEMEDERLKLKERINKKYSSEYNILFNVIKPRAFILIGKSENWDSDYMEAFRRLNYSLHGIEVITYSDLVKRGESIISMLENQQEE